jgi:hypothetical protein
MRWRHAAAVFLIVAASGLAAAVTEPPPDPIRLGLYEWMATAPVVVVGDVLVDDGKYVQAMTRNVVKGEVAAESVVLVDLKKANRDRPVGVKGLELVKGRSYLLLLQPAARPSREASPVYDLVRGMSGARELPQEAPGATIDAALRLSELQQRKNDALVWATVPEFLEDPNPVLVDAALDLVIKFRRESIALLPVLEPLLESPRPDVRQRAVLLVGRVLRREGADELPERSMIVAEVTGRARRDDDVEVRRTATIAIAALKDPGIDETLRTISRDDPDQNVRFEAEKALFERKRAGGAD